MQELIPVERIESRIYLIRGQKVIIDKDLAELYSVRTFVLNQAVKRNIERFPGDFMFSLSRQEILDISQFVISSDPARAITLKHSKNINAFTEQGIAMLSGVLHSERAVQVNIAIMRTFVRFRRFIATHKELSAKFKELEGRVDKHDEHIIAIFEAIKKMIAPPAGKEKKMGFVVGEEREGKN